jgi:integrase
MFRRGPSLYFRSRAGGRDRKKSLGRDFIEACRKYRQIQAGIIRPFDRVIVRAAAAQWIEVYIKINRTPKNARTAESRVKRYLDPVMGHRRVDEITVDDLRRYRVHLQQKGISLQTVAHVLADARTFFRWCEELGYCARAPIPHKFLPKLEETLPRFLTEEELEALDHLGEPWRFVIRLSLATGLRWGEACRADAKHLTRDGWLEVEKTKSHKTRRIPLMETDPVLCREISQRVGKLIPFKENSVGSFNRTVKNLSGLSRFTHHQLRHTFASLWLQRGGNLVALQEVLGHSDIKLTQRYARLTADFVRQEARRQAMGSVPGALEPRLGAVPGTVNRQAQES